MIDIKIEGPIYNYYGTPYVEKIGEEYFFCIQDYDGDMKHQVSKSFYNAWKREFAVKIDNLKDAEQ